MNSYDDNIKRGVWTPWAQVLCYDCHGNENLPNPKTDEEWARMTAPQPVADGNAVTFCDGCHEPIQVEESVAYEHELVDALRKSGFEAELYQSGGMCSACSITPSDELRGEGGPDDIGQILVTYSFDGDKTYWIGVYDNDFSPVEVKWANDGFKSQDEVLGWAFMNQEKIAKIESPELERSAGDRQTSMRFTAEIELHDDAISGTEMEPETYIRQEMGWLEDSGITLIGVAASESQLDLPAVLKDMTGKEALEHLDGPAEAEPKEAPLETFYFSFGSSEHFPFQMPGWVEVRAKDRMEACEMYSSHHPRRDGLLNCAFVYDQHEWRQAGMDKGKPGQVCRQVIVDWGPHSVRGHAKAELVAAGFEESLIDQRSDVPRQITPEMGSKLLGLHYKMDDMRGLCPGVFWCHDDEGERYTVIDNRGDSFRIDVFPAGDDCMAYLDGLSPMSGWEARYGVEDLDEKVNALAEKSVCPVLPDPELSEWDMHRYGYERPGMLPVGAERAQLLFDKVPLHRLHTDGLSAPVTNHWEIDEHAEKDGLFGVTTVCWMEHLADAGIVRVEETPLWRALYVPEEIEAGKPGPAGREGIYTLGVQGDTEFVANVFWSDAEPGSVNFALFAIEGDRMKVIDSGFYDGYESLEDCVRDLAADGTMLRNADIRCVADCSWEINSIEEYREALEEGGLEDPVPVRSWDQIIIDGQAMRKTPQQGALLDNIMEEAKARATEKNAGRQGHQPPHDQREAGR